MFQFTDGMTRRSKRTGEVQTFQNGQWVSQGADPYAPIYQPVDAAVQQGRSLETISKGLDIRDKENDLANADAIARKAEADARLAEAQAREAERKQNAGKQVTEDQQ